MNSFFLTRKRHGIFFNLSFLLIILSLIFTFFDVRSARICFYISSYITVLGIAFTKVRPSKSEIYFVIAFLTLGLSKVLWFAVQYFICHDFDVYNNYLASGKRLLIAAVIGIFLLGSNNLTTSYEKIIRYGLALAFIISTCIGLYQIATHIYRIDFLEGRATDAAYMYAALSTALIFILLRDAHHRIYMLGAFLVFVIAYLMIFFTGTRNTFVSFPLVVFLVSFLKFRKLGIKGFSIALTTAIILIVGSYNIAIKPRVNATVQEYEIYEQSQGNGLGSLTARLAMWHVGMKSFLAHPFGASMLQRQTWFNQYVNTHNQNNAASFYTSVHLHNEAIDTASLQGIFGLVALFFYFIVTTSVAWDQQNASLLSVLLIVLISGLSDVIFISREQTIFFPALMIVTLLWQKSRNLRIIGE